MQEKKLYQHPDMTIVKLSGNVNLLEGSDSGTGGEGASQVRGHRGSIDWEEE